VWDVVTAPDTVLRK